MNVTSNFKDRIQSYLNDKAQKDPLFAEELKKPNKNIDGCLAYICDTARKMAEKNDIRDGIGFDDGEVFAIAVHYYDEDSIKTPKDTQGVKVVHFDIGELSESEKAEAERQAYTNIQNEIKAKEEQERKERAERIAKAKEKDKAIEKRYQEQSLFDF